MIVILYRWRVAPAMEDTFIENWSLITRHYLKHSGGLGSRLHRGSVGIFYAYAQWPDNETHERATLDVRMELARLRLQEAVIEGFPKINFEILADQLAFSDRTGE